jgi:GDP-L-fucose synthase
MDTKFYRGKSVLVTGGTGLVGTEVVSQLQAAGASVRVASLDDRHHLGDAVEIVTGNLLEWDFCKQVVEDMDMVFHLAGNKGSVGIGETRAASFFVPHLLMNTHMMEAARQQDVERYLYTSTVGVYPPADVFVEDDAWSGPPHPSDRFAAWAKRMGEMQAEAYSIEYGWDQIAIVRPSTIYGPFDNFDPKSAMVVGALIGRTAMGENPLVVWGDGTPIRDFLYSADCARGMLLAVEHGADCTPVNLGSGKGNSIRELVEAIVNSFDDPPEIVWDTSKPPGNAIRLMDTRRAESKIRFEAKTSLADGIKSTVNWYLEHHNSSGRRYSVFEKEKYIE